MEQRFYKVRLPSGRVIGPLDLERIKLFIFKGKITGLEMARLYPTGDWKDINTYPEIADLLMQKLEGKLVIENAPVDLPEATEEENAPELEAQDSGITIDQAPPPPQTPGVSSTQTGTPVLDATSVALNREGMTQSKTTPNTESEATIVMTAHDERTIIYSPEDEKK